MTQQDLRADRRFVMAEGFKERGDWPAAASLYREALAVAPNWPEAHFALAEALEQTGDIEAAAEHFKHYLRLMPEDRLGATPRLALLGAALMPDRLPEAYVRQLFDQYAPRFDKALVERLAYDCPQKLRRLLDRLEPGSKPLARVLDLGCGTGLAGEAIRERASWLAGLDLSPGMLEKARHKGVFDALEQGDVVRRLANFPEPFSLILCADVMIYLGDLAPLLRAVAHALAPGGRFLFTTESDPRDSDGYELSSKCRFRHSARYLRQCSAVAGLAVEVLEPITCRQEAGEDVPGWLGALQRPPQPALQASAPDSPAAFRPNRPPRLNA